MIVLFIGVFAFTDAFKSIDLMLEMKGLIKVDPVDLDADNYV